jgi:hypothetical protein
MIKTYQAAHGGVVFYRTPSARQRARRTRLAAIVVTALIGFSGGLLQSFHTQINHARFAERGAPAPVGPFASFPR